MAGINRLTARGIAALTEPGRHSDGGNLYFNITKTGARSWVFFYRLNGKQREMGLGAFPTVTLAEAREKAAEARRLLAAGQDPLDAKKAAKAEAKAAAAGLTTFGEYARRFIEAREGDWKNAKHRAQWRSTLLGPEVKEGGRAQAGPDYCADLRKRPVAEVGVEDVLAVIRPIWNTKRETASRIRQRIEKVLDAAMVEGLRPMGLNPARWQGHLALLLPAHGVASKGHFTAMPWRDLPAFMTALADREGVAARALELLILCASRSGEIRGARWGEFDLDARVWTVPGERMKAGREHRVPLTDRAAEVVQTMLPLRPRRPEDQPGALVFPGLRHAQLSDMTLGAILKRMNITATVHGFRSAFRDWAAECSSAPFDVIEQALAHQIGDATVRAYLRSDLFDRRRVLMEQWAGFVMAPPDAENVVPLRAVGGEG